MNIRDDLSTFLPPPRLVSHLSNDSVSDRNGFQFVPRLRRCIKCCQTVWGAWNTDVHGSIIFRGCFWIKVHQVYSQHIDLELMISKWCRRPTCYTHVTMFNSANLHVSPGYTPHGAICGMCLAVFAVAQVALLLPDALALSFMLNTTKYDKACSVL